MICYGFHALLLSTSSLVQETRAALDKSKIPVEATTLRRFVPAGWILEKRLTADLNHDGIPDFTLVLVQPKKKSRSDEDFQPRSRALVLVFQDKNGGLHRTAVGSRLLLGPDDGGAFYGMLDAPVEIQIKRGVINIEQWQGSNTINGSIFRFRYELHRKQFLLIGEDAFLHDRAQGEKNSISTNYLTGLQITKHERYDEKKKTWFAKSTRKRVPRKTTTLENINFEERASKFWR